MAANALTHSLIVHGATRRGPLQPRIMGVLSHVYGCLISPEKVTDVKLCVCVCWGCVRVHCVFVWTCLWCLTEADSPTHILRGWFVGDDCWHVNTQLHTQTHCFAHAETKYTGYLCTEGTETPVEVQVGTERPVFTRGLTEWFMYGCELTEWTANFKMSRV